MHGDMGSQIACIFLSNNRHLLLSVWRMLRILMVSSDTKSKYINVNGGTLVPVITGWGLFCLLQRFQFLSDVIPGF